MSVWLIILLFAVMKLPLAALMLWMPFRSDSAYHADDAGESDGKDDGGIKDESTDLPPRGPHPRTPRRWPRRRGPHGSPASPARTRFRKRPSVARPRVPSRL